MRTIQIIITNNNMFDEEFQIAQKHTLPEFVILPIDYIEMIESVRKYVRKYVAPDAVKNADNAMEQAGIEDLDMGINIDDVKWYLKAFVSFVPGIEIEFTEREADDEEYLKEGDVDLDN